MSVIAYALFFFLMPIGTKTLLPFMRVDFFASFLFQVAQIQNLLFFIDSFTLFFI